MNNSFVIAVAAASSAPRTSTGATGAAGANASAKVQALETQVADLTDQLSGLERERDFYYNKLRDIELLCQEYEAKEDKAPALEHILEILYATEVSAFHRDIPFHSTARKTLIIICETHSKIYHLFLFFCFQEGFSAPEDYPDETAQGNGEEEEY